MSIALVQSPSDVADASLALKRELATGYRLLGQAGLGLGLLAHLTARLPGSSTFWSYQLGMSVEEVRVEDLREVDQMAHPLDGVSRINPTIRLHAAVYEARPDITCIVHHHSDDCVALGAIGCNLLPFDRNSGRWHGEIDIADDFESQFDISQQGAAIVAALGRKKALLLKHHGVLVTGSSVRDAIVAAIELDRSCRVQIRAMAAGTLHLMPQGEIDECKKFLASDAFTEGTWSYLCRVLKRSGTTIERTKRIKLND